jgi:hypothetical protein
MRPQRPLAERASAAIARWMPLEGRRFALLLLVVLGALSIGPFVHL